VLRCVKAWRAAAANGAAMVAGVTGALRALRTHQVLAAWWGYVQEQVGWSQYAFMGTWKCVEFWVGWCCLLKKPALAAGFAQCHGCHSIPFLVCSHLTTLR
jgi:hypothetical protein